MAADNYHTVDDIPLADIDDIVHKVVQSNIARTVAVHADADNTDRLDCSDSYTLHLARFHIGEHTFEELDDNHSVR